MNTTEPQSQILLYQAKDGKTRVEVRLDQETVWLSQAQMAELYQTTKQNISLHLNNIFNEGELSRNSTVKEYLTVQTEGSREVSRRIEHYNLDAIISVGYRVNSLRGTQFRIWATQRLREYIIKGFTLDDDRLKRGGGGNYFDELLARIRDIRSSEKVFWRKVLDIYSTSIDYNPKSDESILFFKTVQNKMHWAAHHHTAAEIVFSRADASKPNMGMTNWQGTSPTKSEAAIAKNYLEQNELDRLNRIVTAYLDFAELQALSQTPMYMKDWTTKLDDFLRLGNMDLLSHAGSISHEEALRKAELEYNKYRSDRLTEISQAERDFEDAVKKFPKPKSHGS